jgi:hypothetical protein
MTRAEVRAADMEAGAYVDTWTPPGGPRVAAGTTWRVGDRVVDVVGIWNDQPRGIRVAVRARPTGRLSYIAWSAFVHRYTECGAMPVRQVTEDDVVDIMNLGRRAERLSIRRELLKVGVIREGFWVQRASVIEAIKKATRGTR